MAEQRRRILTLASRPCEPPPDTINPVAPPEAPPGARPSETPMEEPPGIDPARCEPEQPGRSVPELPAFDDDGR